ncbi:Cytochrome P450 monooxygenase sdnE [Hyphodiscus hymeniophilus]|uniref:Cytochrome P450 monooxygenase sdnE n=1 Tax=Hyphodiscus hymeniophilus TaxID=353542 RepID=A0A9P6SPU2_9HELO|nr:Cytochrome P450 monooxygenase sdnE [Hyphodiscus hymeniophilus]
MFDFPGIDSLSATFPTFALIVSLSIVAQGVWRLYFSPVSKFLGPKLAALTYWYEFCYDILQHGQYIWKIRDMHERYGPIVRINPHELHVLDSSFYHILYAGGGQKRDRDPWHCDGLTVSGSLLATVSHDLHRNRRAALSSFFSMANTRKLQPVVEERVSKVVERFVELRDSGKVVNLLHALSAFSNDVITEYCFGRSAHRLEHPEFDTSYYTIMMGSAGQTPLIKHLGFIPKLMLSLPESLALKMGGGLSNVVKTRVALRSQINEVKRASSEDQAKRETIFQHLLESDLPESEKSDARLIDEGIVLIGAGSHTVAWTLTVSTFHILSNPAILRSLKKEFRAAKKPGQALTLQQLEKLPYMTAVIKEGLRLAYGVSVRLPRIAQDADLRFNEWVIPRGTSISMSTVLQHQNREVFPEPASFRPERWLQDKSGRLERHLASFNAGSRVCVGVNLAWAELYLCLAAIFDTFGGTSYRDESDEGVLELFETGLDDVEIKADIFFPVVREGSKGVRVLIRT